MSITTRTVITFECDSYKGRKPDRYGGGWDDGTLYAQPVTICAHEPPHSADERAAANVPPLSCAPLKRPAIRCPESRDITGDSDLTVAEAIRLQRQYEWTISRERGGWRVRCASHAGVNGKTIPPEDRPYV